MPGDKPSSGWRRYRERVEARWSGDYYAWVRSNISAEVWTVAAGVISPVVAAVVAYYWWPEKFPVSPAKAAGIAACLGAVGGLVVFLLLLLTTSIKNRLLTPYRLWAADQQIIADLTATCERLETEAARQANENAGEIERLHRQNAKLREFNYREVLTARLELEIGEESRRTGEERLRRGEARLEALENEIGSGDFSNAAEVLALRKILPGIFATGVHGRARQRIIERVHALAEAVETHFRQSGELPPSKASGTVDSHLLAPDS